MASTIKDVAKMAGCSITTVSRYFTAPELVKEKTRQSIEQAASFYKYSPNAIARAMVKQRNHTIAFVVHETHYPISTSPFYTAISEAVQETAGKLGYTVYVVSAGAFSKDAGTLFSNKRIDGAILAGRCEKELLDQLTDRGAPVVVVNSSTERPDIVAITADDYNGTVMAVEHLIERGHRRIGLLSGTLYSYISTIRQNAFIDTMARHELPILPHYIQVAEPEIPSAVGAARAMLTLAQRPTALFCMNDVIAVGAIKAALRMGLRVPQDLAVVGYDDSSICSVIEPELTSVSIDTHKMGELSMLALDAVINGRPVDNTRICLQTRLVQRHSS